MAPGVSVIICCYNSALRLTETLHYLQKQVLSGIGYEIIIVNNASTDNTAACAQQILNAGPALDFTIVHEPESGLSYARRKGYNVAKYDYLIFCDDDNWLAENYVKLAYNTINANPKMGMLGGLAEAIFEVPEPAWFERFKIDFAVGEQSLAKESLSKVPELYGAGLIVRKAYLDKLYASGFKSILSDRKGNQLISGGDAELCYMAKYFGYEIWYHRELRFKHLMTRPRLNWNYMKRLYEGNGKTNIYTFAYKYIEAHNKIPEQNLRLPFWVDTLIHKIKSIIKFYPQVRSKMNNEGDEQVLRFIAMKAEAAEIWALKEKYSELYRTIYFYCNRPELKQNTLSTV